MKIYKTWEVIKMLTENKELIFKSMTCDTCLSIIHTKFISAKNKQYARLDINIDDKWTLIEQSVTWEEIMARNENCRVEHEIINESNFDEEYFQELQEFNSFDKVIYILSNNLDDKQLKAIIKEGKWYLEQ